MFSWNRDQDVSQLALFLNSGALVLGTSDTILGLLAPVTQHGYESLNTLKKRRRKPYLILVNSKEKIKQFVQEPKCVGVDALMSHCWPGPLTLIFEARPTVPRYIVGDGTTIAFRVPDHPGLLKLLSYCDALFSTSANRSGDPVPTSFSRVDPAIMKWVRAEVNGNKSGLATKASTILDCSGKEISIVRKGVYPIDELEKSAGVSFVCL